MKKWLLLLPMMFFILSSCGSKPRKVVYNIGIDPAWFSVDLLEKQVAVFGFCTELLEEFSKESGLKIVVQESNWDTLLDLVDRDSFAAALSGLQPNAKTNEQYSFSNPVLYTGPVLVTSDLSIKTIDDLKGKDLTIENGNELMLNYALSFTNINLNYYDSYGKIVYDLSQKEALAILIPAMVAKTFEQNLYKGLIFIQSKSLIDEGIRLVTKRGENKLLLKAFEKYLNKIQGKHYNELLEKWDLSLA